MKVKWTRKGQQRLQQIYDYIAEDQPANALRFIDRLTLRVEILSAHPRSGEIVSKYQRDDIQEIYEDKYRIIYRILLDRIDVLTVRHSARLLLDTLRKL